MLNNDILRSVRYMLDLSDAKVGALLALAGCSVEPATIDGYLKREDEAGFLACPDPVLAAFLDGLVTARRGQQEGAPRAADTRISNNLVLKKLRIAFELKEEDILAILHEADFRVSRPEINALFRKPGHTNYRKCGDQLLRNFLKGLTLRLRG